MNQKLEIIEHYFKLSDLASSDYQALNGIINLFSNDAVVEGANGVVAGRKKDGKLFALHGFDRYKFNQQNKISFLKVETIK